MNLVPLREHLRDVAAGDPTTTAQGRKLIVDEEQPHDTDDNA